MDLHGRDVAESLVGRWSDKDAAVHDSTGLAANERLRTVTGVTVLVEFLGYVVDGQARERRGVDVLP